MIHRLEIDAWKAFDALRLDLDPGATFIVAKNGIGKTSLVQAAEYALFGEAALGFPAHQAVRQPGATEARVVVGVRLPSGSELSVSRTTPAEPGGRRREVVEAAVDQRELAAGEVEALLAEEFGADIVTLHRLTFVPEGAVIREAGAPFDPTAHVNRLFRADRLSHAANQLETLHGRWVRAGDALRQTERKQVAERDASRSERIEELNGALTELQARRQELGAELTEARARVELAREWAASREAEQVEQERVGAVLEAVRSEFGFEGDDPAVARELREQANAAAEARDGARARESAAHARYEVVREGQNRLREAGGTCPVCRRPIESHDRERAEAEYAQELASLEQERQAAAAELAEAERRASRLDSLVSEAIEQPVARPASPGPGDPLDALDAEVDRLEGEIQRTDEDIGAAREEHSRLGAELEEETARARQWNEAVATYHRAELARLAADTILSLEEHISRQCVEPLGKELAARYEQLWDGRLEVGPGGRLTLDRHGARVDFEHLSGGERAFAVVLLRILTELMTTRARFLWLDEPLEHVDPRNRRVLAALLNEVTAQNEMLQVLVTTYEERVIRRLGARPRASGGAHVVYVDSNPPHRQGAERPRDG